MKALKILLLWGTTLSVLAFLSGGLEWMVAQCMWFESVEWLCINIVAILACMTFLSYRDVHECSGARLLNKYVFGEN